MLARLVALEAEVIQREFADADGPAVGLRDPPDGVDHPVVNDSPETDSRIVAPQPVVKRGRVAARRMETDLKRDLWRLLEERMDAAAVSGAQALVGVDAEDPTTGGVLKSDVAGGGEVVVPGVVQDLGPVVARDGGRVVDRAGVHDDQFVGDPLQRGKASG